MNQFVIRETKDYDPLVEFFLAKDLEFSDDMSELEYYIQGWEIREGDVKEGALIGAAALAIVDGEYVLNGIAVEDEYRKTGIGKELLDTVLGEVKARGGKKLFLVARAPEFFRKSGFITIEKEEGPDFTDCHLCPQYRVRCFPEIMVYQLD